MKKRSLFALFLLSGSLCAQNLTGAAPSSHFLENDCNCGETNQLDRKILAFGFGFGLNRSNLQFGATQEDGDQIVNGLGYRLGVHSELRLGQRFVIAPKADLSFNAGKISQSNTNYSVSTSSLELMGHLKYRFARAAFSPYLLAGPNYRIPLQNRTETFVPTNSDLALDVGLGLDIPLIGFIVSPEVRYTHGLSNITNSADFSDLNQHNIAVSLIFTGK